MDRREILKRAGLGSLALASFPMLATPALADDDQNGKRAFTFVAVSKAGIVGGVDHWIIMEGTGRFHPEGGGVTGRGIFVHFNAAPPGTPKPILSSGRWKATKFVSYDHRIGTYGRIAPSILEVLVTLLPDAGTPIKGATLRLICDVGPAGLDTGEPEGYKLTIPGAPFGTFTPLDPPVGITHIGTSDA